MPLSMKAFKAKCAVSSETTLDFFDINVVSQEASNRDSNNNEHSCGNLTAFGDGIVRFEDGRTLLCGRSDIQFKYADHLHYSSFGDLITRAVHTPTNRKVAVKIVRIYDRLSGKNDGRSMKDILRKMRTANDMRHEDIVRMHGFVIEEMTCYMVMERMEASLSEVIRIIHSPKNQKLEVSELEDFLGSLTVDIVGALAFMSEREISAVVSPKRILLGNEGAVKIAASSEFRSGDATPLRYSAPELIEISADKDYSKTGVWSLGITLIEAATGKYPYSGSIDFVIADQIVDETVQPRLGKEYSLRMRGFVASCLFHSTQSRSSARATDANCLQNKQFYKHYMQRENRREYVQAILHSVQPHLEETRREQ